MANSVDTSRHDTILARSRLYRLIHNPQALNAPERARSGPIFRDMYIFDGRIRISRKVAVSTSTETNCQYFVRPVPVLFRVCLRDKCEYTLRTRSVQQQWIMKAWWNLSENIHFWYTRWIITIVIKLVTIKRGMQRGRRSRRSSKCKVSIFI